MSDEIVEIDLSAPAFLLEQDEILQQPPYARVCGFLEEMLKNPPQALLIEGGSTNERLAAAMFWAAMLNCENDSPPCLACSTCQRITQATHRDFFVLDGRAGSIKIDSVREVRGVLGEPPREAPKRVILLAEAQSLGQEAANALLKSMEEPRPDNCFILTSPQRERLLPTLVSRSWILTLPWPMPGKSIGLWEEFSEKKEMSRRITMENSGDIANFNRQAENTELKEWEIAFANFLQNGQGWFARTGTRGATTPQLAAALLARCQSALAATLLQGEHIAAASPLYKSLAGRMDLPLARRAYEALAACQTALHYNVNPSIVLDWLAVKLFIWLEELRRVKK